MMVNEIGDYIKYLKKLDTADEQQRHMGTKLKERRAKIKTKLPYSMRKIND